MTLRSLMGVSLILVGWGLHVAGCDATEGVDVSDLGATCTPRAPDFYCCDPTTREASSATCSARGAWVCEQGQPRDRALTCDQQPTAFEARLVRVQDVSNDEGSLDAGVDLDAILVETAAGGFLYAEMVLAYNPGVSDNVDTSKVLGAPDAFPNWEVNKDASTCQLDGADGNRTFVSLGGTGHITVQMEETFGAGDTLHVLEVGGCDFGDGIARAEAARVEIAIAGATTSDFVTVVDDGIGPVISAVITEDDIADANR